VVADTLSRRLYPALNCLLELPNDLCKEFCKMELNVIPPGTKSMLYAMEAWPTLIGEIRVARATDPHLEWIREEILVRKALGFVISGDDTIRVHNRVCVLAMEELKKKILDEGHNTPHSVPPRGNKLCKDLK